MSSDVRMQAQWWNDTNPGTELPFAENLFIRADEPMVPSRAETRAGSRHRFHSEADQQCHLVSEEVRVATPIRNDLIFTVGIAVHQWWAPWMAMGPLNPPIPGPAITPQGAQIRQTPAWHPAEVVACMGLCVMKYAGAWHREQVFRVHMPFGLWEGPTELVPLRYLRKPTQPILAIWADQPPPPQFWAPYIAAITCPHLLSTYPGLTPNFLTMELFPTVPPIAMPNVTGSLVCLLYELEEVDAETESELALSAEFLRRMREVEIDFGPGSDLDRQAHSFVAHRAHNGTDGRDYNYHAAHPETDEYGNHRPAITIKPFTTFMLSLRNVMLPYSEYDIPTAYSTTNSMGRGSSSFSGDEDSENAINL